MGSWLQEHWIGQCSLPIVLQHLHTPFVPFPHPFPLSSLYTHAHTFTHVHTNLHWNTPHTGFFTTFFSLQDSLCLSLSHTHTMIFTPFFSPQHTRTAVSIVSAEDSRNSMTSPLPCFNPSPFPILPTHPSPHLSVLLPITTLLLQRTM